MNKKKCIQGMDGMNLEYSLGLEGMEKLYLPVEELKNEYQNTIVKIDCIGGKIRAYINAPNCIKPNNVKSLGLADSIKLELVQSQVVEFMQKYLQKHLCDKYSSEYIKNLWVTALEMNITLPCIKNATPSDVVHLFDMAFDKTMVFRKRKATSKCDKVNTGILYAKPKEYRLKIYDKSAEMHEHGNPLVENNLLRMEIVMIDRSLKSMFGDKRTLADILTKQALVTLCEKYKDILVEDIIQTHIVPYLNECRKQLVESLTHSTSGHEISDTISRHRELIVDWQVLSSALHKWYGMRNVEDRTNQMIYKYRRKNLGIPDNVIATIKKFHASAG